MNKLLMIALAGAMGSLARYGLAGLVQRFMGASFPWGTTVVNIAGCFFFGLVWALAEHRINLSPEARAMVLVGFMGAFTTFSTFIFETGGLLKDSQWLLALANVGGQTIAGLFALWLGMMLARAL